MKYYPQLGKGKPYKGKDRKNGKMIFHTTPKCPKDNEGFRYPKAVLRFNTDRGIHPTQKPVALIEYLIKTYTLEGELILDNTAGSGTLAIAAINTNRQYICIEKDPHYFEVMRDRIANHDPFAPIKTKKVPRSPKGQLTFFDGGLAV